MKGDNNMIKEKIYEWLHKQPYGTEEVIDISKIIIKKSFKLCTPREWKMDRCREAYKKKKFLDEPITIWINKYGKYILSDGYTRYLLAVENGLDNVPVKYI
jgi:hypothetical protein